MRRTDTSRKIFGVPVSAVLMAGIGLGVSVALYASLFRLAQKDAQNRFAQDAFLCINRTKSQLEECERLVGAIKVFFECSQFVSRDEFLNYGRSISKNQEGLDAICWLPIVPKSKESEYEAKARCDGLEEFQIRRMENVSAASSDQPEQFLIPIYYILPYRGNENLLGLNAADEPALRKGFELALRENRSIAILNSTLFEKNLYKNVVFLAPIYESGALTATLSHRRASLKGYIASAFNLEKILYAATKPSEQKVAIELILPDGTPVASPGATLKRRWTSAYNVCQFATAANADWRIEAYPVIDYLLPYQRWMCGLVFLFSIGLSALLTLHLLGLHRQRAITESIVQRRTAELQREKQRCQELMNQAQAANEAKSQFLANMSHEIRTPMNSIIGFADLLAEDDLTDQQRDFAITIRDNAKTLLGIINDILDLSKIEAGKISIQPIDCDLRDVIEKCADTIYWSAKKKGLEFRVRLADDLPSYVRLDDLRVRQCILNLLNNAIKFTQKGYVSLNVNCDKDDGHIWLRLDVEDTGIGIPADRLQAIFEPFVQADGSTTRLYGGTGLGLTITKKLIEQMGGTLSVRSDVGKGSIFTLRIPTELVRQPSVARSL